MLAGSAGASLLLGLVAAISSRPPGGPATALMVAVVIAGAAAAMTDPAEEVMRSLPVSAVRRLATRAAVIAVPAAAGMAAISTLGAVTYGSMWVAPGALAVTALGACALAVVAVTYRAHRRSPGELAAGSVIIWVTLGVLATEAGLDPAWTMPWWHWPAAVLALATAVTAAAARNR